MRKPTNRKRQMLKVIKVYIPNNKNEKRRKITKQVKLKNQIKKNRIKRERVPCPAYR
jgi:hypothetical protein